MRYLTGFLFTAMTAVAQLSNATLSGVISDPAAAAIPAAELSAKHTATNRLFKATADASGRYTFLTLPIGEYEIAVQARGFKSAQRSSTYRESIRKPQAGT